MQRLSIGGRIGRAVFDLVLPPRCPLCRIIVPDDGAFCADCWRGLGFLTDPMCDCCGTPFPYAAGDGAQCAACAADRPPYRHARAALVYDDASARLVLGLKYGDRTQLASTMARLMTRAAAPMLADAPLLVPVPLHPRRLRQRLYNQSALLARALCRETGMALGLEVLERVRDTRTSRGLSRSARAANVRGAIRVGARGKARVAGRNVLVVDDVMTTGATVEACARALLRAGARNVDVVTFARVTDYSG